jgi:hypothetical protein
MIEPTFSFNINDEFSASLTTGLNLFNQPNVESVANIPIQLSWQDEIGDFKVTTGGGIDLFDRPPPVYKDDLSAQSMSQTECKSPKRLSRF